MARIRGIYFTLDALFAAILIGLALILASKYYIMDSPAQQINYYSKDIVSSLSTIKISEINDSYVKYLISTGEIINLDNSIMEQIGEFYVLNKTDLARNLSIAISRNILPEKFGFEVLVNGESIYLNNTIGSLKNKELISSRRLISGIEKFRPLRGATSKVFLEGINSKKYASYLYFGGFIGQGNISGFIDDISNDANITSVYMELDSGDDFTLKINNIQCGSNYTSGLGSMTADAWDISYCNSSLRKGAKNNFTISFHGDLGAAYLGGGFIRVDYLTTQMQQEPQTYSRKEWLPGIRGIVNLYSSFYVPGTLNNISLFIHYYVNTSNQTNNTFYLTIGNATIFRDSNLSGEKNYTLTANNITSYISLATLSSKTTPIRIGFENVSFGYIYDGNADVALITDVSGSMDWRMDSNAGGTLRNCNDTDFNLTDTRRISVAKCLDKQFSRDIINISGNRVGLISYSDSTDAGDTITPTTSQTTLDSTIGTSVPETGYNANGGTCICCGINSARTLLTTGIGSTTLISIGSSWRYNNFSLQSAPEMDSMNNSWFSFSYQNESQWHTGNAILGATNSYAYAPAVTTEIGSNLVGMSYYANLWENTGDTAGPPNDFTSNVLNSTGNTYGINGANDGWDWDTRNTTGVFGNDDDIDYNSIVGGKLEMDNNYGGSGNVCTNRDCSGAYGILFNISQEMYDTLNSGGRAEISFAYEWDDVGGNVFESEDEVWVKARWTLPNATQIYLGSNIDSSHTASDTTNDITAADNPDNDFTGTFSQELASLIPSPGRYYLEIGGKVTANSVDEYGTWKFDNIQIMITNITDRYYFRKNFTINNLDAIKKGILNVLSDDKATVYLNGEIVDIDTITHNGSYWDRRGKNIAQSMFRLGNNVIAVEVLNSFQSAKFDLEIIGLNDSKDRAIMLMTDGVANYECTPLQFVGDGDARAIGDAIDAACDAREDYGINVYAVGYSDAADEDTLQQIALCGDGIYTKSNNVSVLQEFYQDVASTIVSASRHAQTINIVGNVTASVLYDDSYINLEYTPLVMPPQFGEISILKEEKNFDNCTFHITIPQDIRISNAKMTSYSSEHWTDGLTVNGIEAFNLSVFSDDYTTLGDPFIINIPATSLSAGRNNFSMRTGDSPTNSTDCSLNNSVIYTSQVTASVSYSDVLEKADGCNWHIEFDDGDNTSIKVPLGYLGLKDCYYTNITRSYDINDTYDDAMYKLLDKLDFDKDGRIYVNIKESNLIVGAISVGKVPYPWGPAIAEVRVWR